MEFGTIVLQVILHFFVVSEYAYDFVRVETGCILRKMLSVSHVRRALIVGCLLQLFQQIIGINTVMYVGHICFHYYLHCLHVVLMTEPVSHPFCTSDLRILPKISCQAKPSRTHLSIGTLAQISHMLQQHASPTCADSALVSIVNT